MVDWLSISSFRRHLPRYLDSLTIGHSKFLEALLHVVKDFNGCDLLMYQAGGDQHQDDPLGGFLTTEEMRIRDRIVFAEAKAMGIPVVWNLAGGYQIPHRLIADIHRNTMLATIAAYLK